MVLAFVVGTFGFNYQVTIALMAREVFDLGAEAFGLLSTFFAVGSLTGALLSTRRSVRPRQRFLVDLGGRVRPAHRRRRADAGLRRRSPSLLVPTGAAALDLQRGQQQLRAARRRPADARPGDGALLHVLHGRHARRRPADRLISEHLGAPVGADPRAARSASSPGIAAALVLARGRRVRLEGRLAPPRLRLRIGERRVRGAVRRGSARPRRPSPSGRRASSRCPADAGPDRTALDAARIGGRSPAGVGEATWPVRSRSSLHDLSACSSHGRRPALIDRSAPGRPRAFRAGAPPSSGPARRPRPWRRPIQVVAADLRRLAPPARPRPRRCAAGPLAGAAGPPTTTC